MNTEKKLLNRKMISLSSECGKNFAGWSAKPNED